MKTLLWKELRENIKWALLAMLAFGAAAGYSLFQTTNDSNRYQGVTLVNSGFLMVTTFGAPVVALLLGFLQTLPELKADRWAALLHRPTHKATVFWAKVLAGTLLYILAVGIPYALMVWWVATPGNFRAPFIPSMIRPGVVDLFAGLMYYFAALVIALQKRRSLFLRPVPILAALHVSFFTISTPYFHLAMWATAAMSFALLVAAQGTISSRELFHGRSWLGKASLLLVTIYGLFGLGDLLLRGVTAWGSKSASEYYRWELTKSGPPVRFTYKNNQLAAVHLPDGSVPTDPKLQLNRITAETASTNGATQYIGDAHGWKPRVRPEYYRESYSYVGNIEMAQFPEFLWWYYLPKDRYFVAFQYISKKPLYILDAEGFRAASKTPHPFPSDMDWASNQGVKVFPNANNLTFAFLATQKTKDVPLATREPVFGLAMSWANHEGKSVPIFYAPQLTGISVYKPTGDFIAFLPYSKDVDRWGQITVATNPTRDQFQIFYEPSVWIERKKRDAMPSFVDNVDTHGVVLKSYELPPLPRDRNELALNTLIQRRTKSLAFFVGQMAYDKIGALAGIPTLVNADRSRWTSGLKVTLESLYWSFGWSILLSITTFIWSRKAGFGIKRIWAWTTFVFLLGIPGILAFRLVSDWPVLAQCAHCKKKRPVDLSLCPHCTSAWPAPQPDGFEIMDAPHVSHT